jgi:hypothetical protein
MHFSTRQESVFAAFLSIETGSKLLWDSAGLL